MITATGASEAVQQKTKSDTESVMYFTNKFADSNVAEPDIKAWVQQKFITHKPLSESTVAFLGSVSSKKVMTPQYFKATADYLVKTKALEVIVLIGGTLKRHNFWDSKIYQEKLKLAQTFTPPTIEQVTEESLEWEKKWIESNAAALHYLQANLGTRYQPLRWADFLNSGSSYQKIHKFLWELYQANSKFRAEVDSTVDARLKEILTKKKIREEHTEIARAHILKYVLEEAPMLSRSALNVDYLFYPEDMSAALKAIYPLLNPMKTAPTRWIVPKFQKAKDNPVEVIGYSSTVDSFEQTIKFKQSVAIPIHMTKHPLTSAVAVRNSKGAGASQIGTADLYLSAASMSVASGVEYSPMGSPQFMSSSPPVSYYFDKKQAEEAASVDFVQFRPAASANGTQTFSQTPPPSVHLNTFYIPTNSSKMSGQHATFVSNVKSKSPTPNAQSAGSYSGRTLCTRNTGITGGNDGRRSKIHSARRMSKKLTSLKDHFQEINSYSFEEIFPHQHISLYKLSAASNSHKGAAVTPTGSPTSNSMTGDFPALEIHAKKLSLQTRPSSKPMVAITLT